MSEPLQVLDLPQLHQKPSAAVLLETLSLLETKPSTFKEHDSSQRILVSEEGLPRYLTAIIGSSLAWIEDESAREEIQELASSRLTERSGRTAMGDMTRHFEVVLGDELQATVQLHEPALTGDNLGLKTWSSSFVLANNLRHISLASYISEPLRRSGQQPNILELGSGTGLVGLVAAMRWSARVLLTDLPDIVGNLAHNIQLNSSALTKYDAAAYAGVLDWARPSKLELEDPGQCISTGGFSIVLAADPIYSPEHPALLVAAMNMWLSKDVGSLFVLAYPIREAYAESILSLRALLDESGLRLVTEHHETSADDWKDQVTHSWSVWTWKLQ